MVFSKKILVVSNCPFFGGGESFIVHTLIALKDYFDVYFIVKNDNLYNALPEDKRIKFECDSFLKQLQEVRSLAIRLSISVVLLNGGSTLFFAPFLKNIARVVMYRHTTNKYVHIGIKRAVYIILIHICYLFASKIIHVSKYSLSEQKIGCKKATYIYHGVDILQYKELKSSLPLQVLFVGRTDKSKGIDIIINAFRMIPKSIAVLHIVGTGVYDTYIKDLKKENIIYHGFRNDTASYYENCDVFISLPKMEAFGLTVLEAMNHSKPIITTRVGAIPEIVNITNAIFVDRTVPSLLNAIYAVADDTQKLIKMGKCSYEITEKSFRKTDTIQNIVNVINSI